jgi:hypothetical protein
MEIQEYKEIQKIRTEEYKLMVKKVDEYFALFSTNNKNVELYVEFWEFSNFIEEFELKAIKAQGKQRENALEHLKMLYRMQQFNAKVFARFNYENFLLSAKSKRLQKEQFTFLDEIKELKEQIELTEKINNL